MTTQLQKRFDRKLKDLFDRRTHWIRSQMRKPTVGKPPTFSRKHVDEAIEYLTGLVEASLVKEYVSWGEIFDGKRQWHSKGWGAEKKRKQFLNWYDKEVDNDNCVYVFWASKTCRYVGRTLHGKNRPQAHFYKAWFPGVTRVDIYYSKTKRNIPKLECLATHRFKPSHSKIKPSTKKWFSRCPICEAKKMVRSDVRSMFRFRK